MIVLPRVSGQEMANALSKIGYQKDRQKGSHIVLRQVQYPHRRIVIPNHREVAKGTLRAIVRPDLRWRSLLNFYEPPLGHVGAYCDMK